MESWIYDIEVLPNYFGVTFENVVNTDYKLFEIYNDRIGDGSKNDMLKLIAFLTHDKTIIGYNNSKYDDVILKYVTNTLSKRTVSAITNTKIYELSRDIVEGMRLGYISNPIIDKLYFSKLPCRTLDLMKILALDKQLKSLKQTLINVNWEDILDFEPPPVREDIIARVYYDGKSLESINRINQFNRFVTADFIDDLRYYNLNDVRGTKHLYKHVKDEIRLRYSVSKLYGVDVLNSSRSNISDILLEKFYASATGLEPYEFINERTIRTKMKIGSVISDKINFKTDIFKNLKHKLDSKVITSVDELKQTINFNGVSYEMGAGGLHSKDKLAIFRETDEYIIRDVDAASYYPNLILMLRLIPKHLREEFLDVLRMIVTERLLAKKNGIKLVAEALKIVINAIYGKLGSEFKFIYDRLMMLATTVNGQLFLFLLIEDFVSIGVEPISANTDGIVCKIPRDKEAEYYAICDRWKDLTGIDLEYTDYITYVRRDVNNYISVKRVTYDPKKHIDMPIYEDDKGQYIKDIKRKGMFNKYKQFEDLAKGVDKPIIAQALEEYFVNDVPIEKTIREEKDITKFFISHNTASKYRNVLQTLVKGEIVTEYLQKNLRYYISAKGGVLLKYSDNSYTHQAKGLYVTVMNKLVRKENHLDYNINYPYYISKTREVINGIEDKQTSMFF
jgi:DNA polymerase elongation subunit (family B)